MALQWDCVMVFLHGTVALLDYILITIHQKQRSLENVVSLGGVEYLGWTLLKIKKGSKTSYSKHIPIDN